MEWEAPAFSIDCASFVRAHAATSRVGASWVALARSDPSHLPRLPIFSSLREDYDFASMGGRVLVVEDDEPIREAVEELLRDEGWDVVGTHSIDGARAALSGGSFDVMLLDLLLEGGSGEKLLEELRQEGRNVPTVIMSASTRAAAVAKEFGTELLRKPFELETMLDRMQTVMKR